MFKRWQAYLFYRKLFSLAAIALTVAIMRRADFALKALKRTFFIRL